MNDKTIWITGASTGIGKALAIKFAQNGWNVAASARRENLLKELEESSKNIYLICLFFLWFHVAFINSGNFYRFFHSISSKWFT